MKNIYLLISLSIFIFWRCTSSNENRKIEDQNLTVSDTVSSAMSEREEIVKVAQSFHEWYCKAENKSYTQPDYPFTARLFKTDNGYDFDLDPYFNQLRGLKTISNNFLESERNRFSKTKKIIDEYYPIQTDSNYIDIYNDCSDDFYYYRMSQDALYSRTDVVSFSLANDNKAATVVLSLVPDGSENVEYIYPQAKVKLEKESDKWMIVSIKPNN